ncbi:hypothetical protein BXZ70DRAFT_540843 [Cristinia sonorae]|uniref:Secreted protein n=1 Tax=Cristinia sonorae TaxID=1940300 RepID=A0A8K0UGR1_9AGAR|nr:hypothetical protein BXZ70DRAFT_540843 [Cristinia sonorae]
MSSFLSISVHRAYLLALNILSSSDVPGDGSEHGSEKECISASDAPVKKCWGCSAGKVVQWTLEKCKSRSRVARHTYFYILYRRHRMGPNVQNVRTHTTTGFCNAGQACLATVP